MLTLFTFGCGSSDSVSIAAGTVVASAAADIPTTSDVSATAQTTVSARDPSATPVAATIAVVDPATPGSAAGSVVEILDFTFGPQDIQVALGGQVTWINQDNQQHTATAAGGFDTDAIKPGDSAVVVFDTAGSFSYICSFHPFMSGSIVVVE